MAMADEFKFAGISAAHIDGSTPKEERDKLYQISETEQ